MSDRELWHRAGAGDGDAFGELFDRHREPIRAYCARRSGSVDVADDMVSIVFPEAWRRRSDVEMVHDSLLPWLYGAANHTLRRRTRTTLRHRRLLDRLPRDTQLADHADDVAARLDDRRDIERLHDALQGLRRSDQEVAMAGLRADGLQSMFGSVADEAVPLPGDADVLVLGGDSEVLQDPPGGGTQLEAYQLYGLAGEDVTGVDVVLADGTTVTATVSDGVWGLWYPATVGDPVDSRLAVHTSDQTRVVDPADVQMPWPDS